MVQVKLRAVRTAASQKAKVSAKKAPVAVRPATRAGGTKNVAKNPVRQKGGVTSAVHEAMRPRAQSGSKAAKCVIVQTYSEPGDRSRVDPEFTPCKVRGGIDGGFSVLKKIHASGQLSDASMWGILPLEFASHTALSSAQILGLANSTECDYLYCAPEPESDALFHNVWIGTEAKNSGCMELAQSFLAPAGVDGAALWKVHPLEAFASPSFIIAKTRFWTAYVSYVDQVVTAARKAASPHLLDMLSRPITGSTRDDTRKSCLSLITDNLLSLFITSDGARFKAMRLPPQKEERVNVHLRLLREMRDVALKTKSRWLAACWVNYRNLYLGQTRGQEWCRQYLRLLTPMNLDFASGVDSASNGATPANI